MASARDYIFVIPLILAIAVIIYHSMVIAKIVKNGTSISDKTLWLPNTDSAVPMHMAGTDIRGPNKLCRVEPTPSTRDMYGETVTAAKEVPCGDCNKYLSKIGDKCMPMTFQVRLQDSDISEIPTGFCVASATEGDPEYQDMIRECPFRVSPEITLPWRAALEQSDQAEEDPQSLLERFFRL